MQVVRWWSGVVAIAALSLYLSDAGQETLWSPWGLVEAIGSHLWLVFPFVAFSGGLAVVGEARGSATKAVIASTFVLAALAWVIGAYVVPVAELRADAAAGYDVEARYPFGANTPSGIFTRRADIVASPPTSFGFSVEAPLQQPPNWLLFLIHQPFAFAVFGLVNALLGLVSGWATSGLSPPKRRNARWGLGLGSALFFYLLSLGGAAWVQRSPDHSALVGAWLPVVYPLLLLGISAWVARQRDLHAFGGSDV